MTATLFAVGSVSASRSVHSGRFYCIGKGFESNLTFGSVVVKIPVKLVL